MSADTLHTSEVAAQSERRWRSLLGLRRITVAAMVVLLVLTAGGVWATHTIVGDQERRLLDERTSEVNAALAASIGNLTPSLATLGEVLTATKGSASAFSRVATVELAAAPGTTFAWLQATAHGYVVESSVGTALQAGQVLTGVRAATVARAAATGSLVATPVIGVGAHRALGVALGGSQAPAGTVLYRESRLGPVAPPRESGSAPFRELEVVLYASPRAVPQQVLVTTTSSLPLQGSVAYQTVRVGASRWLLAAEADRPLVGSVAAWAQWAVLAIGLLVTALCAAALEIEGRRRDAALALYAGEHEMAETLQRSLLPVLPPLAGLDVAARYLAGGTGQQVGGDWFDVFPLAGDRIGVVIGDVMGHDMVAAAAMAQIRASLRAFAWQGRQPSAVLTELDRLVDAFGLAQLVTVFYGTIEAAGADGDRVLRYANAGHLPPLLRQPDGTVGRLDAGASVLIGAIPDTERPEQEVVLRAGATLLCFTDGLIEVPGGSIEGAIDELGAAVSGGSDSADALCDRLLEPISHRLRDDVAVLAVTVRPAAAPATGDRSPAALRAADSGV